MIELSYRACLIGVIADCQHPLLMDELLQLETTAVAADVAVDL